jgi:hypothetical protein
MIFSECGVVENKKYKVWITIEEYDPEAEKYEDIETFPATRWMEGSDGENKAFSFATDLSELAETMYEG